MPLFITKIALFFIIPPKLNFVCFDCDGIDAPEETEAVFMRMLGLEAEQELCLALRQLVGAGQVPDAVYIALALGLREGGYELVHGKAALGGVASFAGDDDVVYTA